MRPENSRDHQQIGARGAMCLLHVSQYGLTLALQVHLAFCLSFTDIFLTPVCNLDIFLSGS